MVPTMSLPMFLPDFHSSPRVISGFTAFSSLRAEEIDMATSITAPRDEMIIPPTSKPRRPMGVPVWRSCSSGSTSEMRKPLTWARACAPSPNTVAKAIPAMVPRQAHKIFRFTPPRITKQTTAI